MKIIGVTGKTGAGKTTFTKCLGERKNVGVIHLDKVMNDIKEDKFQGQIKSRTKNNEPKVLSNKMRSFIHTHKIPFKIFMAIKKAIIRKSIQNQIAEYKREGKDAVVIEGVYITEMVDAKLFDSIVYIKRPYNSRIKAVQERDDISKEEIVERDFPYQKNFSTTNLNSFDYVIENNYGKEELRSASKRIYDEVVGIKTFDERYAVNSQKTPSLRNIVRVFQKNAKNNRNAKTREE